MLVLGGWVQLELTDTLVVYQNLGCLPRPPGAWAIDQPWALAMSMYPTKARGSRTGRFFMQMPSPQLLQRRKEPGQKVVW